MSTNPVSHVSGLSRTILAAPEAEQDAKRTRKITPMAQKNPRDEPFQPSAAAPVSEILKFSAPEP